ncbi:MAG: hypothetical protein ABR974_10230 [Bacteroidales bacterium]|jgi:hypothetical protein
MNKLVKLSMFLIVLMVLLPECMKNTSTSTGCLVTSVIQGKRKIIITYTNNVLLKQISDYLDTTSVLSLNLYNFSYNNYGQLSAVTENLEGGVYDSISLEYSGGSRIVENQYLQSGKVMVLNSTRDFIISVDGYLLSDTLYGSQSARKSFVITGYSQYAYDGNHNPATYTYFNPDGSESFSVAYNYGDTLIQNSSYNIARFSCIDHYGSSYQIVFPQISRLPTKISTTINGETTIMNYTYDLDSHSNPVTDYSTVSGCADCNITTTYKYGCN